MQPSNPASTPSPDFRPHTPATPGAAASATAESLPRTIPIIEESARIEKEVMETGRVVLRKTVRTDTETVEVPTQHEQVHVERIAVNRYVDTPPETRHEGDTMIIPVLREEVVVTTRLLLVEELHVRKQTITTTHSQPVELRREHVSYERISNDEAPSS